MSYMNPSLNAELSEVVSGCIFAENFLTESLVEENQGELVGTGLIQRGLTLYGSGYLTYPVFVPVYKNSITVKFRTSNTGTYLLYGPSDIILQQSGNIGPAIWLDDDGIKARCSDANVAFSPLMSIDFDYADNEWHVVTYVYDNETDSNHYLWIDGALEDVEICAGMYDSYTYPSIGGDYKGYGFIGNIDYIRIYDFSFSHDHHLTYAEDRLRNLAKSAIAHYRGDEQGNQNLYILDNTVNANHLRKETEIGLTTDSSGNTGYLFEGSEYVSKGPELGSDYTVSAAYTSSVFPTVIQEHDQSWLGLIKSPGWEGNLHSLFIYDRVLNSLEKKHLELHQLRYLNRRLAKKYFTQLINSGDCVWFCDFATKGLGNDESKTGVNGAIHPTVRWYPLGYLTFPSSTSRVTVADNAALCLSELTIFITGKINASYPATLTNAVKKGNNYSLKIGNGSIDFNGSIFSIAGLINNKYSIAITAKHNEYPELFLDGEFFATGDAPVTVVADTGNLYVGNANTTSPYAGRIQRVAIFNRRLALREIKSLVYSGRISQ